MKIQITLPESAIKDVTEYCRVEGIDLHGRMQQELDDFVCNAIGIMEQRRKIRKKIHDFQGSIKELFHAD